MKKLPERTCMACNEKKPKNELIRIVRNSENNIEIDLKGKKEGRGTYICSSLECLEKVKKTKRLQKTLEREIPEKIYDELKKIISGGEFIG